MPSNTTNHYLWSSFEGTCSAKFHVHHSFGYESFDSRVCASQIVPACVHIIHVHRENPFSARLRKLSARRRISIHRPTVRDRKWESSAPFEDFGTIAIVVRRSELPPTNTHFTGTTLERTIFRANNAISKCDFRLSEDSVWEISVISCLFSRCFWEKRRDCR